MCEQLTSHRNKHRGRIVQGAWANEPGGQTSQEVNEPGGESSRGRNGKEAKKPDTRLAMHIQHLLESPLLHRLVSWIRLSRVYASCVYGRYVSFSWCFWRPVSLVFDLLNQKLAHRLFLLKERFTPILVFLCLLFSAQKLVQDGQTDKRIDRTRIVPIRMAA